MSNPVGGSRAQSRWGTSLRNATRDVSVNRAAALVAGGGLVSSFAFVLYDVVETIGDPTSFYPVVFATLVGATLLARVLRTKHALVVAFGLFVVGLGYYATTIGMYFDVMAALQSVATLATGVSVLWIPRADLWALAVVPAPVFATWFLALRRRYVQAALVGGVTLFFLVLTGDAGLAVTLLGIVSGAAMVGFGDLDHNSGTGRTPEYVTIVLGVMVIAPFVVTMIPGGAAGPVTFVDDESTPTMEENVVGSGSTLELAGTVEQSPEVRFVVESEEPQYWRTGSYDRYTGDGWVQTVEERPYTAGALSEPEGRSQTLTQNVTVETTVGDLPAAWQPVDLDAPFTDQVRVTDSGAFELDTPLGEGEQYTVTSEVPTFDQTMLEVAGTSYSGAIERQYTQLPDSTPDRVQERTEEITEAAENPYQTALLVERWLSTHRGYSLDVERPDGDIVDAFLFEMEEGYCTYHATAMVGMLRSVDIPARLAVGYTPGEQVEDDRWVVRGLNSHAWVEVYFPGNGWVAFDPTPTAPRQETEVTALGEARADGVENVDTAETRPDSGGAEDRFPDLEEMQTPNQSRDDDASADGTPGSDGLSNETRQESPPGPDGPGIDGLDGVVLEDFDDDEYEDSGLVRPWLPPREHLALAVVVLAGVFATVRRAGVPKRLVREVAIRFQRRSDPETDVERAHDRLLLLLEHRERPREPGETMRQYLRDIDADPKAHRLVEIRQRARYGNGVSEAEADEAVALVNQLRNE